MYKKLHLVELGQCMNEWINLKLRRVLEMDTQKRTANTHKKKCSIKHEMKIEYEEKIVISPI